MESNFKISPRILDHFGVAAYTSLNKCLAELCSNCYDADAENVWVTIPDTIQSNSTIRIKDDGLGMSLEDLNERYLFIGYNRRVSGEISSGKRRPIIGNKGIGKLAGFGIANQIEIISIKDNKKSRFILNKNIFDDFNTLSECKIDIQTEETNEDKGTELILHNLSSQIRSIDTSILRTHLFKVMPNVHDFSIFVNEDECTAEDIPGEKIPIEHEFPGVGKITGFYVIAKSRVTPPGMIIRVRKRAITEPSLFGLEKRSHFSFSTDKLVGEINADFLDPFINTSRDNFLTEIEEVQILEVYLNEYFKNIINEIEKEAEGKRTKKIIDVPDIKGKLEKLPPHIRVKARKVIEGVILKLKTASDDEINELVDWIIKYFESNVLRELMNSILDADNKDIEKLSELINNWGLRQINSVTDLIKDQIDIILKLEELIDSDKSLEIEVHKLIEKNLWLVREGLELWASDKPLKKVLEDYFDKIFKDNENERPDLVCNSRDEGNEAIILEFKKPSVKVTMEHVTQALKYKGVIQSHRPSIKFDTFVVGRKYQSDVIASKEDLAKANIYLWSFSEILQRTRFRFEKILEILED